MLNKINFRPKGPVLIIVLDGVGIAPPGPGNAFALADTKNLDRWIEETKELDLYCELKAHGPAVGLPSEEDMGNSEVGHNTLGSGQIVAQGPKLVNKVIESGDIFDTGPWKNIVERGKNGGTLHLIGLLSDGNVHSHMDHLFGLLDGAVNNDIEEVRIHVLLDGRDVPPDSSLDYIDQLQSKLDDINDEKRDYRIASGGGRMYVTMDRYESNWQIVKRGWDAHVRGVVADEDVHSDYPGYFSGPEEAIKAGREHDPKRLDQYALPFVIMDGNGKPVGKMEDGDAVIFFNFRGDRALEITRAFEEEDFQKFDREEYPDVFYCGMMEYDSELGIPENYLVEPPSIPNASIKYLCKLGIKQFAIAETHKFGHVTYFWNGNTSDYFDRELESYREIKSLPNEMTESHPGMKGPEVTEALIRAIKSGEYPYLRCNYANGDMVGHTGNLEAAVEAMTAVDECLGKVVETVKEKDGITIITADHGNCEDMLDRGKVSTKHSCNPVFFMILDRNNQGKYVVDTKPVDEPGLSNVASTLFNLLGYERPKEYRKSLIRFL